MAILTAILLAASMATTAAREAEPSGAPEWFQRHMEFMVQQGGRWITDNAAYRSEDEPYDAYGMEWQWGLGKRSIKGRLFMLRGGKEVGTAWEFRAFWHPGDRAVHAYQFGGHGAIGTGRMESTGERTTWTDQEFFNPDGTRSRVGHDSTEGPGGKIVTRSYDIKPDGSRAPRRTYTWTLEVSSGNGTPG